MQLRLLAPAPPPARQQRVRTVLASRSSWSSPSPGSHAQAPSTVARGRKNSSGISSGSRKFRCQPNGDSSMPDSVTPCERRRSSHPSSSPRLAQTNPTWSSPTRVWVNASVGDVRVLAQVDRLAGGRHEDLHRRRLVELGHKGHVEQTGVPVSALVDVMDAECHVLDHGGCHGSSPSVRDVLTTPRCSRTGQAVSVELRGSSGTTGIPEAHPGSLRASCGSMLEGCWSDDRGNWRGWTPWLHPRRRVPVDVWSSSATREWARARCSTPRSGVRRGGVCACCMCGRPRVGHSMRGLTAGGHLAVDIERLGASGATN